MTRAERITSIVNAVLRDEQIPDEVAFRRWTLRHGPRLLAEAEVAEMSGDDAIRATVKRWLAQARTDIRGEGARERA